MENLEYITRPEIQALKGTKNGGRQVLEHLLKQSKAKGLDLSTMCTWKKAFNDKNQAEAISRFLKLADDYGVDPKDFPELHGLYKQLLTTPYGRLMAKSAFALKPAAKWFGRILAVYIAYQVVTNPEQAIAGAAADYEVPIGAVRSLLAGEGQICIDLNLVNQPLALPVTLKNGGIITAESKIIVRKHGKVIAEYVITAVHSTGIEGIVDIYVDRGEFQLPTVLSGVSRLPCTCPDELVP